jgi:hypothetical protein
VAQGVGPEFKSHCCKKKKRKKEKKKIKERSYKRARWKLEAKSLNILLAELFLSPTCN